MRLGRFFRHTLMHPVKAARAFPAPVLDAIQREIAAQEKVHRGEICVVVEAELTTTQLWHDVHSRQRAREVFAAARLNTHSRLGSMNDQAPMLCDSSCTQTTSFAFGKRRIVRVIASAANG